MITPIPCGIVSRRKSFFQAIAFGGIFDFAGNAALSRKRHEHDEAPGDGDIRRRARTFRADLIFRHLDDDFAPDREQLGNVRDFIAFPLGFLLGAFVVANKFDGRIVCRGQHIPVMQKRVFLLTDVHERRFQTFFEILNATFEDGADHALFADAFEFVFFEHAVRKQRRAFFERLRVDDQFAEPVAVFGKMFHDALKNRKFFARRRAPSWSSAVGIGATSCGLGGWRRASFSSCGKLSVSGMSGIFLFF